MRDYFIRRLLLVPITLFGVTLLVFLITRIAPGGPMESALMKATMSQNGEAVKGGKESSGGSVMGDEAKAALAAQYGYDQPFLKAYFTWLGVVPREMKKVEADFEEGKKEVELTLPGGVVKVAVTRGEGSEGEMKAVEDVDLSAWKLRIESPQEVEKKWRRVNPGEEKGERVFAWKAVVYQARLNGVLQGYLGESSSYNESVWSMMMSRFPISIYYGVITMILTYVVCIPLGIVKAIKHRTPIDNVTSILVFVGYAIPGYVLGALLMVYLGARLGWFPIMDFVSENFSELSFFGKVGDLIHHSVLPLICYMVGAFAFLTMLMKNSLMDNLAADYVRTAAAKGVPFRTAVFRHALRNSIIPIATTFGQNVTLFVSGSMLIEKIFDIDGFGLLSYSAVLERDTPVIMGTLSIAALLMLLGNIISDVLVAMVDPRVSFK